MGCDIHVCAEIKIKGKWHLYSQPRLWRNYTLFAHMSRCGRREDIDPIVEPRGLPKNASTVTKAIAKEWDEDGHSHSWFGPEELKKLYDWLVTPEGGFLAEGTWKFDFEQAGYLFGNHWDGFIDPEFREDYPAWVEDVRWVFWFDN